MVGYREALTRLFLQGCFPGRAQIVAPRAPRPRAKPPQPEKRRKTAAPKIAVRHNQTGTETTMTHPGQILARHLIALGMTATDLARDIDVPVNRVTAILNGQRGITADTALRLGHWFGVDPEDWLGLQTQYELALARREIGAKVRSLRSLVDRAGP